MRAKELRDLVISALLLALAFGIAFSGGYRAFSQPGNLLIRILMALIGISLGFILHELGHRFVARRFNCFAEYVMWPTGLMIALAFSFFGFVFAAPGAVMIHPRVDEWGRSTLTRKKIGLISITGPALNLGLAVVFALLWVVYPTSPGSLIAQLFLLGALVNTWLAIFNLIPFGPLDGAKIFRWHKGVWTTAVAVGIGLFIIVNFVI